MKIRVKGSEVWQEWNTCNGKLPQAVKEFAQRMYEDDEIEAGDQIPIIETEYDTGVTAEWIVDILWEPKFMLARRVLT